MAALKLLGVALVLNALASVATAPLRAASCVIPPIGKFYHELVEVSTSSLIRPTSNVSATSAGCPVNDTINLGTYFPGPAEPRGVNTTASSCWLYDATVKAKACALEHAFWGSPRSCWAMCARDAENLKTAMVFGSTRARYHHYIEPHSFLYFGCCSC